MQQKLRVLFKLKVTTRLHNFFLDINMIYEYKEIKMLIKIK